MGLFDWYRRKKQVFDDVSEQVRADMLRKQMHREKKSGSMAWAYGQRLNPFAFGKLKMNEHINKKKLKSEK